MWHVSKILRCTLLMWSWRCQLLEDENKQSWQEYSLILSWTVLTWYFTAFGERKNFSHFLHCKLSCFIWNFLWTANLVLLTMRPQASQVFIFGTRLYIFFSCCSILDFVSFSFFTFGRRLCIFSCCSTLFFVLKYLEQVVQGNIAELWLVSLWAFR